MALVPSFWRVGMGELASGALPASASLPTVAIPVVWPSGAIAIAVTTAAILVLRHDGLTKRGAVEGTLLAFPNSFDRHRTCRCVVAVLGAIMLVASDVTAAAAMLALPPCFRQNDKNEEQTSRRNVNDNSS